MIFGYQLPNIPILYKRTGTGGKQTWAENFAKGQLKWAMQFRAYMQRHMQKGRAIL